MLTGHFKYVTAFPRNIVRARLRPALGWPKAQPLSAVQNPACVIQLAIPAADEKTALLPFAPRLLNGQGPLHPPFKGPPVLGAAWAYTLAGFWTTF